MRVLLLSSLVVLSAAAVPGLPSCASSCVGTSFGSCNTIDVKCICGDSALIAGLACCVSTACDAVDQMTTIQFADALCAGQGVSNLPSAATCASTSGSPSSTTASSGSATSSRVTPVPLGSASSSLSSVLSSASSAAASMSSSAASTMSSSMSGSSSSGGTTAAAASSASATAASASGGSSTVASASASVTGSSAGNKIDAGIGFGALLAGALAVL